MFINFQPSFKKSWDEFGFTADSVISKLPPFARDKKEVRKVITTVVFYVCGVG